MAEPPIPSPRDSLTRFAVYAVNRLVLGITGVDVAAGLQKIWNFLTAQAAESIVQTAQGWADKGTQWNANLELVTDGDPDAPYVVVESETEVVVLVTITNPDGSVKYKTLRLPVSPGQTMQDIAGTLDSLSGVWLDKYGSNSSVVTYEIQYVR